MVAVRLVLATAAALLFGPWALQAEGASLLTVHVAPAQGVAGSQVRVYGHADAPHALVSLGFLQDHRNRPETTATTDAHSRYSALLVIPATAHPGPASITALRASGNNALALDAFTPFQVRETASTTTPALPMTGLNTATLILLAAASIVVGCLLAVYVRRAH